MIYSDRRELWFTPVFGFEFKGGLSTDWHGLPGTEIHLKLPDIGQAAAKGLKVTGGRGKLLISESTMKVIFRISVLFNLVLLGLLVFNWRARHGTVPEARVAAVVAPPPPAAVPTPTRSAPALFRWSQLDASDYHLYVKNLRAIGCPEPSVRAIVTADVQAVYGQRQRRLEQKLASLMGGSWSAQLGSANEQQAIQVELQEIPGRITAMIDDLLGIKPSPVVAPPTPAPVSLPLALQELDLTEVKMDQGQIEALKEARQRFLAQTGGTPPNPNDVAAVQRWQKAAAESDDQMEAFLGSEAYQTLQLQVFANSQSVKAVGQ